MIYMDAAPLIVYVTLGFVQVLISIYLGRKIIKEVEREEESGGA